MMTDYIKRAEALEITTRTCGDYAAAFAEIRKLPAADVAEVVHGTPVTEVRTRTIVGYHEEIGVLAGDRSTLYRRNMVHVDIPYDCCPVCGATLCSRWHNFCGKCGAKMDGGNER
jgi:hypothetical protein|nr:MAG TPA: zinc-ribbon containing domain protein [Caudoviricetes sp.]